MEPTSNNTCGATRSTTKRHTPHVFSLSALRGHASHHPFSPKPSSRSAPLSKTPIRFNQTPMTDMIKSHKQVCAVGGKTKQKKSLTPQQLGEESQAPEVGRQAPSRPSLTGHPLPLPRPPNAPAKPSNSSSSRGPCPEGPPGPTSLG